MTVIMLVVRDLPGGAFTLSKHKVEGSPIPLFLHNGKNASHLRGNKFI